VYAERSVRAARDFVVEVDKILALVAESPGRWPRFEEDSRRIPFRRFPFVLIYRETNERIEVLALAHGRRRPGYWRDRKTTV